MMKTQAPSINRFILFYFQSLLPRLARSRQTLWRFFINGFGTEPHLVKPTLFEIIMPLVGFNPAHL